MCQVCVSEGRITQEELDARKAAGDMTYAPMFDLSREDFSNALTEIVLEAIMGGMDPEEAVNRAEALAHEYVAYHQNAARRATAELN